MDDLGIAAEKQEILYHVQLKLAETQNEMDRLYILLHLKMAFIFFCLTSLVQILTLSLTTSQE